MIIMGYSLPRSAIYCTIFSIIIAAISPETRMSPRKLLQTLMDGVRQAANIADPHRCLRHHDRHRGQLRRCRQDRKAHRYLW